MNPAPVSWAPLGAVLGGLLLFLSAWEAESNRAPRESSAEGQGRRLRGVMHPAQEVRLAAWFFAGMALLTCPPGQARLIHLGERPAGQILALGTLIALLIVPAGWLLGSKVGFPLRLRWTLAPFHGLSTWLLWSMSRLRERPAGKRERGTEAASEEQPGSPQRGVADLATVPLEEIMVPRSQVVALPGSRSVREAVAEIRRFPHALYPVHGDSVDTLLGVVRILDLAGAEDADRPVRDLIREAPIVPETMKGLSLLGDLCGAPIPAALVVDEFGGMAGLVTVEDLVEVLVGDLTGEHDVVRARILPQGPGLYRVEGACSVDEFNAWFGPVLPEGAYETVAGFCLDRLGKIPVVGESLETPRLRLEVLERTERRVLWLSAELKDSAGSPRFSGRPPRSGPAPPG